jgi:hypothetical protein
MLKISAVYLVGDPEIPIHYTIWVVVDAKFEGNP